MQTVCTGKTTCRDIRIASAIVSVEFKAYGKVGAQPRGDCRAPPPEPGGFVERDTQTFASTFAYATFDDDTDFSRSTLANP